MRRGFTVIEIIFVVTIVAILIGIAAPRLLQKDDLSLAADQVINHIRYTQHLALMEDRFDPNNNLWFREGWQIAFHRNTGSNGKWAYSVFVDQNGNRNPNVSLNELASHPLDRNKLMTGGFDTLELGDPRVDEKLCIECAYDVTLAFDFPNNSYRLAFDELGRPYTGYSNNNPPTLIQLNPASDRTWLTQTGHITITHQSGDTARICIEPETGYTHRCD